MRIVHYESKNDENNLIFSSNLNASKRTSHLSPTEKIFTYIFKRICNGMYLPGTHINEHKISKELKISIILIRQAIEKLMVTGLIERVPNRGVFIKKVSLKDHKDVYEARRMTEMTVIRKVARSITEPQLQMLEKEIEILSEETESILLDGFHADQNNELTTTDDPRTIPLNQHDADNEQKYYSLIMADIRFHLMIIRFYGNPLLEKLAEAFIPKAVLGYRLYHSLLYGPQLWRLFVENLHKNQVQLKIVTHQRIYQALADHDEDLAEQLLRDHTEDSYHLKKAKIELLEHIHLMNTFSPVGQLVAKEA